jgi:hypothetical protein
MTENSSEAAATRPKGRPLFVLCDEEILAERAVLASSAWEAKSILETIPGASKASQWRRGRATVSFSGMAGRTTTIEGGRSPHARISFVDGVSNSANLSNWVETRAVVDRFSRALETLRRQTREESLAQHHPSLLAARDTLAAAAAMASMTGFDVATLAPDGAREASLCVYQDGPRPWILKPAVERRIAATIPDLVRLGFDAKSGAVSMESVEIDDQADEEIVALMRMARKSGLTPSDLELRHDWPRS